VRWTICLLNSKVGMCCCDVVEIGPPLFPSGMNAPMAVAILHATFDVRNRKRLTVLRTELAGGTEQGREQGD
jgi:hypothetical protein